MNIGAISPSAVHIRSRQLYKEIVHLDRVYRCFFFAFVYNTLLLLLLLLLFCC